VSAETKPAKQRTPIAWLLGHGSLDGRVGWPTALIELSQKTRHEIGMGRPRGAVCLIIGAMAEIRECVNSGMRKGGMHEADVSKGDQLKGAISLILRPEFE
jgi:hypothetical protein